MKVVFFGTSNFAIPALTALHQQGYQFTAVVTPPDKPAGRKKIPTPPPVKITAQKLGLKILQPPSLKTEELENYLEIKKLKLEVDDTTVGIVASYGQIIPANLLEKFPYGLLNIHPSKLPLYRGPTPIQTVLLNGETETAVTIMQLDPEMDHGPILVSQPLRIENDETYTELSQRLAQIGADLLVKTLPDYLKGKIVPQEQNQAEATYTKKLSRVDGKINWRQSAHQIFNRIRALNPEPGTWTVFNKTQELKILKAQPTGQPTSGSWGEIIIKNKEVLVATSDFLLRLDTVQPAGKTPLPALLWMLGIKTKEPRFD